MIKLKNKIFSRPRIITLIASLLGANFAFSIAFGAITQQWPSINNPSNIDVSNLNGSNVIPNSNITKTSDGNYIILWTDHRNSENDIYGQKYNAAGEAQWTAGGLPIIALPNSQNPSQSEVVTASDGAGGIIFAWDDNRTANTIEIYAQRMNGNGTKLWQSNGILVSQNPATTPTRNPKIIADGNGGIFITWQQYSTSWNLYAQHIDANGDFDANWNNGAPLLVQGTAADEMNPQLISDGAGGIYVGYEEKTNTNDNAPANQLKVVEIHANGTFAWDLPSVMAAGGRRNYNLKMTKIGESNDGFAIAYYNGAPGTDSAQAIPKLMVNIFNHDGTVYSNNNWPGTGIQIDSEIDPQSPDGAAHRHNIQLVTTIDGVMVFYEKVTSYTNNLANISIYGQKIITNGDFKPWGVSPKLIAENAAFTANDSGVVDRIGGIELTVSIFINPTKTQATPLNNGALLTYYSSSPSSPVSKIYAQYINNNGDLKWGTGDQILVSNGDVTNVDPKIIAVEPDGAIIAWDSTTDQGLNYSTKVQFVRWNCSLPTDTNSAKNHCLEVSVTAGSTVFRDTPANITFPAALRGQTKFSNREGAGDDDYVTVDYLNNNGFDLQLAADGDFQTGNGQNKIPLTNFKVITSLPPALEGRTNDVTQGVQYNSTCGEITGITSSANAGLENENPAGADGVGNNDTFTAHGQALGTLNSDNPPTVDHNNISLMNVPGQTPSCTFYQHVSYAVTIPNDTPPGDYSVTLTFTLLPL